MIKNKYDISISNSMLEKTVKRLTNQMWKLIPMRENEEDWLKQLNTVKIEIVGLNEIFLSPSFLSLLAKIEGLSIEQDKIDFDLYRKTIFECINLLQEALK